MNVRVNRVNVMPGSTLGYGWGVNEDDPDVQVFFAGDWRPMAALDEAVGDEGSVSVYVEPWQVMRAWRAEGVPA